MVSHTLLIIIILAVATMWYGYAEECDDHGSAEPQSGGSGNGRYIYPYDPYDGPYWPPDRHNPYDHDGTYSA